MGTGQGDSQLRRNLIIFGLLVGLPSSFAFGSENCDQVYEASEMFMVIRQNGIEKDAADSIAFRALIKNNADAHEFEFTGYLIDAVYTEPIYPVGDIRNAAIRQFANTLKKFCLSGSRWPVN